MATKIGKWIRDHKKQIIIGSTIIVGSVVVYKLGRKPKIESVDLDKLIEEGDKCVEALESGTAPLVKTSIPINLGVGRVDDLWDEGGCINLIINDIKVTDLGKLGDGMIGVIKDVNENTEVSAVISLINKEIE